jgi:glycosyltransferase involved in cell wall biosynthesis
VSWQRDFFYPASAYSYKNHETLLKAIRILKHQGIVDYRVLLTLKQDSLPKSCEPYLSELQDNVVFLGNISHQEVMELYCKSVLVFPSYIEAYGLPLKEASLCDTPIIAADRPFSREVLMGYDKVSFYPAFESEALAAAMIEFLQRKEEQDI